MKTIILLCLSMATAAFAADVRLFERAAFLLDAGGDTNNPAEMFTCSNLDWAGPKLVKGSWRSKIVPEPTQKQLDAVTDEMLDALKTTKLAKLTDRETRLVKAMTEYMNKKSALTDLDPVEAVSAVEAKPVESADPITSAEDK